MKLKFRYIALVSILFGYLNTINCSLTIAALVTAGASIGYWARCKYFECCNDDYILKHNTRALEYTLRRKVYGQHIAIDVIVNAIDAHRNMDYAHKPLTLSFHGWTGSGKNYVTSFIVENLYKKNDQSAFVHYFVGRLHFPEVSKVPYYKRELYEWVKGNVSQCPEQMFIFDEVHLMPAGVLDGIKSLLDYNASVEKVDYRKSIFIFLSNTGGSVITSRMIELWNEGKKREDIALSDFESLISKGAFNEKGGFEKSDTIKNNLIDHYVPFLPMEKKHIELCIKDEFRMRGFQNPSQETIEKIMDFVEWGPSSVNKFSTTGCKRLSQKVAMEAQKMRYNSNH